MSEVPSLSPYEAAGVNAMQQFARRRLRYVDNPDYTQAVFQSFHSFIFPAVEGFAHLNMNKVSGGTHRVDAAYDPTYNDMERSGYGPPQDAWGADAYDLWQDHAAPNGDVGRVGLVVGGSTENGVKVSAHISSSRAYPRELTAWMTRPSDENIILEIEGNGQYSLRARRIAAKYPVDERYDYSLLFDLENQDPELVVINQIPENLTSPSDQAALHDSGINGLVQHTLHTFAVQACASMLG